MFKPRKVGLSGQGSRGLREGGGNCLKYLKRGGTERRGEETKILKRGGQARSMGGCLKKGVCGWNLLTNYDFQRSYAL